MVRFLGLTLIALGVVLLAAGTVLQVYPMAGYMVNTAPSWMLASDGTIGIGPRDGQTYSSPLLILVGVRCDTGVSSVVATIDQTSYALIRKLGSSIEGVWYSNGAVTISAGSHSIKIVATGNNSLTTTYQGTFLIYAAIQGNWYINNQLINSTSDVIYGPPTAQFRFVKTVGIQDSAITCTISEGSTNLVQLTLSGSGTWVGSYTFGSGMHTISMVASDGQKAVIMSVMAYGEGGIAQPTNILTPQYICWGLGALFSGVGLGIVLIDRRGGKAFK